jgi:hypothetical protein
MSENTELEGAYLWEVKKRKGNLKKVKIFSKLKKYQKMKNLKKELLFLLILLTVLLTGCFKEYSSPSGTTRIQGFLLEYGSEKPLEGIALYLKEITSTSTTSGSFGTTTVDSFYTNEDGYFNYEFEDDGTKGYIASYQKIPGYYDVDFLTVNTGNNIGLQSFADPYAWLKLRVKNVNPVNQNDKIRFGHPYSSSGSGWQELYGTDVDEIYLWQGKGYYSNDLIWKVSKLGISTEYKESLFLPAHDTMYYEILY